MDGKRKNRRIIVTGGIASGKSTVVSKLKSSGIGVVDADEISHKMFWENVTAIRGMFNTDLDGQELRKHIGSIVFKDVNERTKIENLLLPLIHNEMDKQARKFELKGEPFIYDIPLYFERTPQLIDDYVVLVYVNKDVQLDRLKKRNDLTHEEATDRINSQMSPEDKLEQSDFIIDNNGDVKELDLYISKLIKEINKF